MKRPWRGEVIGAAQPSAQPWAKTLRLTTTTRGPSSAAPWAKPTPTTGQSWSLKLGTGQAEQPWSKSSWSKPTGDAWSKPAVTSAGWGRPAAKPAQSKPAKPFQRAFLEPEDAECEALREELQVSVEGAAAELIAPVLTFEELGVLPDYVLQSLTESGRETPMPIQAQALPIILAGHDLIGIAKTGSGKTLAFLLPAIVHIEPQEPPSQNAAEPIALILAPTRELVAQIAEEAGKLCMNSMQGKHPRGIWAQEVYGGKARQQQLDKCNGASIVAATPGRLADFVDNQVLSLHKVTYFVLDEADRMLDDGFQDEISKFSDLVRRDRHTLYFSATWPQRVQELATKLCLDSQQPAILRVGQRNDGAGATRSDINQRVMVFDQWNWSERERVKKEYLYSHLREVLGIEDSKILVFVGSKVLADELAETLAKEGFTTDSMHGGRKQWDRDEVLARFKRDEFRLLIATDVMGRGLDIPTITHVVIYDMGDIDDYVHRIGRTARGNTGRVGNALTLFEYNKKWPELAGALVQVLEDSEQEVPDELRTIAEEVENGERDVVDRHVETAKKPTKTMLNNIKSAERRYDAAGKPICKFHLEGCCTKADWCEFSHGDPVS